MKKSVILDDVITSFERLKLKLTQTFLHFGNFFSKENHRIPIQEKVGALFNYIWMYLAPFNSVK